MAISLKLWQTWQSLKTENTPILGARQPRADYSRTSVMGAAKPREDRQALLIPNQVWFRWTFYWTDCSTARRSCVLAIVDARSKCEAYRREYNEARPHNAIGNKTPLEFIKAIGQPSHSMVW